MRRLQERIKGSALPPSPLAKDALGAPPRSLYRHLTLALVLVALLVSILTNSFNYWYSLRVTDALTASKSAQYTLSLREQLEWPLWSVDDETVAKVGRAFASNSDLATLVIRDEHGRVIYEHQNPDDSADGFSISIEHAGKKIGGAEFGLSLKVIKDRERKLLWGNIATLLLLVAGLLLVQRWALARLLKKPVQAFVRATQDMVEGRYQKLGLQPTYEEFNPVLDGFRTMSDAVAQREQRLHQANAKLAAEIAERKLAEAQIQALAFSDPLTGLPNRRLLMDRLEQALAASVRHENRNALLFIDLDDFKSINDTLGHDKGDQLLRQISTRLISCVRELDTVARLGGDEFVVVVVELSQDAPEAARQAQAVGEKILEALGQPYQLDEYGHYSSASIGVTLFGGAQPESAEESMKRAELAMYQAKTAGRNALRFFEPKMQTTASARATLEAELREAVNKGQFVLHYQPQVTADGQMSGVEALLRWQHPQQGLVSPAAFIPIAEASGLILSLGQWVLQVACQQLAAWAVRPEMAHLVIAVNVSARQLRQASFVGEVAHILHASGAKPERLKLELTESVLVDNVDDIMLKMCVLKARGVGFSLDDFGTGYSSLTYLKRLPLDQLKIDQAFVRDILTDPHDAAIAKMVLVLADSLGLEVIAEGIETAAQRDFLTRLGCHRFQGYLFSRPLPIQELEAFAAHA